jgi:hypothetical protein
MSAETILQRLDKVKRTGKDKWSACCPCHDSKSGASLSIQETDDGRILLHDHGGCGAAEILSAIGLEFSDLYPPRPVNGHYAPKVRRAWNAHDVLTGLALEVLVAYQFAKLMVNGDALSDADRERLLTCASRLQSGLGLING